MDNTWPKFTVENRNLRPTLSVDGINPHSSLSSKYNFLPDLLITYNVPLWLCMKRKFMLLSLLISGPRQPNNDIDVYLVSLINGLKTLWDVKVEVYDACKDELFTLRVILIWTINDFLTYENLLGAMVKGYYAYPMYAKGTNSCRLKHQKRIVYMCHHHFLPLDHLF